MSNAINMEVVENLANTYVEYFEKVDQVITTMFSDLIEIMNEQKHDPLYKAAINFEETYNDEVVEKFRTYVHEWADGDSSFAEIATLNKMNEESISVAQNAQDAICDAVDNTLHISNDIHDKGELHEAEKYDAAILAEKLDEWSNSMKSEISNAVDTYSSTVRQESEENEAVNAFVHVDEMIANGLKDFVTGAIENFTNTLGEEVQNRMNSTAQKTSDQKEAAKAKAQQMVQDAVANATAAFASVFDD